MEQAVRAFLRERGIVVQKETPKGELVASCPYPDHEDEHASFAVNKSTGLFCCFGCGRKGSFERLYADLKGLTIWRALEEMQRKYDLSIDRMLKAPSFPAELPYAEEREITGTDTLRGMYELLRFDDVPPYQYTDRGLGRDDWLSWGGRFDDAYNMMTFPVGDWGGNFVALVGRSLDPENRQRYMSYTGSKPKLTLYGIDKVQGIKLRNDVILCEGLFDTQRVYKVLGDVTFVFGLLSAGISKAQKRMFDSPRYDFAVNLWLDNDEAGERATEEIGRWFVSQGYPVNVVPYYFDAKDQSSPGVIDEAIVASFENRRPFHTRGFTFPIEL